MYIYLFAAWLVIGLNTIAVGVEVPSGSISINPTAITGTVNRKITGGQNIHAANWLKDTHPKEYGRNGNGMWDPAIRQPVEAVVKFNREMGVTMLRYPGGCLAHLFDWKQAIGPLEKRPDYTFGLMEYLELCRVSGAEPQIIVGEYVTSPESAAELVEFLNAPATPAHPWAQQRAAWGHPEPYRVKYFEMGNESYHGNHGTFNGIKNVIFTPTQYSDWFKKCEGMMRKVDPAIRLGAVTDEANGTDNEWNRTVIAALKDQADFLVVHIYIGGLGESKKHLAVVLSPDYWSRIFMASQNLVEDRLNALNLLVVQLTGKRIPLAITEYNGLMMNKETPVPLRHTFALALFCGDYMRYMLEPENNVILANYYLYYSFYWGANPCQLDGGVLGKPGPKYITWDRKPINYVWMMYQRHFGDQMVKTAVKSPELECEGGYRLPPCRKQFDVGPVAYRLTHPQEQSDKGYSWKTGRDIIALQLRDFAVETYPELGTFDVVTGASYMISFEAKIDRRVPIRLGLGLVDNRGWEQTGNAVLAEGIESSVEWTKITNKIVPGPGCQKMNILLRLRGSKNSPVTADIQIRNLKIEKIPGLPPYQSLTAAGSVSADGKKLYLIVFNKDVSSGIDVNIMVTDNSATSAQVWTLSGPPEGTNTQKKEVFPTGPFAVPAVKPSGFSLRLPPCSMNAIEIDRRQ